MEGYEPDNLIVAYARPALEKSMEAAVVSADKDLMQLIRPGVEFYDPMPVQAALRSSRQKGLLWRRPFSITAF